MADFFLFRSFNLFSRAKEYEHFFLFHHITCRLERKSTHQNLLWVEKADEYRIKVLLDDQQSHSDLLDLSDEKLLSFTQQSGEAPERYRLALELLKVRVAALPSDQWDEREEERMKKESEPAKLSDGMYWFIFLATFLSGIIGVVVGLHVVTAKRKLSNGQHVYLYAKDDRKIITWLLTGVAFLVVCFVGYLLISVIFFKH